MYNDSKVVVVQEKDRRSGPKFLHLYIGTQLTHMDPGAQTSTTDCQIQTRRRMTWVSDVSDTVPRMCDGTLLVVTLPCPRVFRRPQGHVAPVALQFNLFLK